MKNIPKECQIHVPPSVKHTVSKDPSCSQEVSEMWNLLCLKDFLKSLLTNLNHLNYYFMFGRSVLGQKVYHVASKYRWPFIIQHYISQLLLERKMLLRLLEGLILSGGAAGCVCVCVCEGGRIMCIFIHDMVL